MEDIKYIELAIEQARKSVAMWGFPAGSIVVKDGEIIGEGVSIGDIICDPTAHGEIDSIRKACDAIENSNLEGATLYSSMETCASSVNDTFLKPIEIVHIKEKEEESLAIVKEWEEKSSEK